MAYVVQIAPRARRQISQLAKKLPKGIMKTIADQIDALSINPRPLNVKKLESSGNFYRVDVKDYRIVYTIEDKVLTVLVVKVAHRKDVYSKKLR